MNIDALIPCYNSEAFIRRTIASVLEQTRAADRIILHDDQSSDATPALLAEIASQNPSVQVVRSSSNVGILISRQRLVSESRADVVCFLDHDDEWPRDYLAQVAREFERGSVAATIAASRCVGPDGGVRFYRVGTAPLRAADLESAIKTVFLEYPVPSWSCLALRREIAARLSTLSGFHSGEEFALLALALEHGDAEFLDLAVTRHLMDSSASRLARKQHQAEIAIFCWFASRYPSLATELPAKLSAIYANSVYRYTIAGEDQAAGAMRSALARGVFHLKIPAALGARALGQRMLRRIRPPG